MLDFSFLLFRNAIESMCYTGHLVVWVWSCTKCWSIHIFYYSLAKVFAPYNLFMIYDGQESGHFGHVWSSSKTATFRAYDCHLSIQIDVKLTINQQLKGLSNWNVLYVRIDTAKLLNLEFSVVKNQEMPKPNMSKEESYKVWTNAHPSFIYINDDCCYLSNNVNVCLLLCRRMLFKTQYLLNK